MLQNTRNLSDLLEAALRKLYYRLHPDIRRKTRKLIYLPGDVWNRWVGGRSGLIPPKGSIFIGSGDFIKHGQDQVTYLRRFVALRRDEHILDIGCGIGRTAVALTEYVFPTAQYHGFDVVKEGITWCNRNITTRFPNFQFKHVPIANDLYRLHGAQTRSFRFPYQDNMFDLAFHFSVFTHMPPEEVQQYLREIHRVLKAGGRCLGTFFTYTAATEEQLASMHPSFSFPIKHDGYRLMDARVVSANVAYSEEKLRGMVALAGLNWESLHEGYWKDQAHKLVKHDFQDIVVLSKS